MKCNACSVDFADGLTQCPGCGKKYPKQYSIFKLFGAGVFAFVLYKIFFAPTAPFQPATVATSQSASGGSPAAKASWSYSSYKDKMTGKEVNLAVSKAQESLDFKFPYAGKNVPSLTIRKSTKGAEVLLEIEKGQFICMAECKVAIKFDDKAPVNFSASGPSDGSSDTLFLGPASKIVASLKSAKTVLVQATFYQEGTQAITFKTDGLVLKE